MFSAFSIPFGRGVRLLGVAAACVTLLLAAPAATAPKGFKKAEAAWSQGDLEAAQGHYEEALERGGLKPKLVLIAYSRIGTVKAALGDKQGALSAFRVAAAIDPEFQLPDDSGPVAQRLYAQALSEAAQQGEVLSLQVTAPDNTPAGERFTIETEIPEGFAVFVAKVVVTIEDPVTGKKWRKTKSSEPSLVFDFPGRVAVAGAKLKVTGAAVDGQKNAWVMSTAKIKVDGTRKSFDWGDEDEDEDEEEDEPTRDKKAAGGGFFSGPVPWIIGGAVVVGGIILFAATRSSGNVAVGAPKWQ